MNRDDSERRGVLRIRTTYTYPGWISIEMALPIQALLRLPTCLRAQTLAQMRAPYTQALDLGRSRSFSTTAFLLQLKPSRPPPPGPSKAPPKPVLKRVSSARPTAPQVALHAPSGRSSQPASPKPAAPETAAPSKATPKPTLIKHTRPASPAASPSASNLAPSRNQPPPLPGTGNLPPPPKAIPYVQSLFPKGVDEILLYKAPKHLSFRIACYVVGILFFVGGWSWAAVLRESAERATLPNRTAGAEKDGVPAEKLRLKWWVQPAHVGVTLVMAVFGTLVMLAPVNMAKRISLRLVHAQSSGPSPARPQMILRCALEQDLPFMKAKIVDGLAPAEAFLDKKVRAVDIDFRSLSPQSVEAFTASANSPALPPESIASQNSVRKWFGDAFRDIRRMFYRDGIAYLRLGTHPQSIKIDLQHCEMLDWGRPLDAVTQQDYARGVGPIAWMKRKFWKEDSQ